MSLPPPSIFNKSKTLLLLYKKLPFFHFFFVKMLLGFHKAASSLVCFALAHVKKYARESLFLDISERERTLLKEHCLSV